MRVHKTTKPTLSSQLNFTCEGQCRREKHLSKSVISGVSILLEGRNSMWAVSEWNKAETEVWVLVVWEKYPLQAMAPGSEVWTLEGLLHSMREDTIHQVSRSLTPLRLCMTLLSTPRETTVQVRCQVVLQTQGITKTDVRHFLQSNITLIMGLKNKQWLSGSSSIPLIEGYTSVTFLTLPIYLQKLTLI